MSDLKQKLQDFGMEDMDQIEKLVINAVSVRVHDKTLEILYGKGKVTEVYKNEGVRLDPESLKPIETFYTFTVNKTRRTIIFGKVVGVSLVLKFWMMTKAGLVNYLYDCFFSF